MVVEAVPAMDCIPVPDCRDAASIARSSLIAVGNPASAYASDDPPIPAYCCCLFR